MARLLLDRLWRRFDAAGEPHGRSLPCRLLKGVLSIFPLPDTEGADKIELPQLLSEAARRNLGAGPNGLYFGQARLFPNHVSLLQKNSLFFIALAHVGEQLDRAEESFDRCLGERRILKAAKSLLKPDEDCKQLLDLPAQTILQELGWRRYLGRKADTEVIKD